MRAGAIACGWLLVSGLAQPLHAGESADDRQAHFDYMLNCQGCHLPDGDSAGDTRMKGL